MTINNGQIIVVTKLVALSAAALAAPAASVSAASALSQAILVDLMAPGTLTRARSPGIACPWKAVGRREVSLARDCGGCRATNGTNGGRS